MKSSVRSKRKERLIIDDGSDQDFATQGFEARESDAEQLWDVVAIRGERAGMYLIQWAGTDDNGNPWEDSWVPREDVTDDVVEEWKKQKAAAKKEKSRKLAKQRERQRQRSTTSAPRSRTDSKVSNATSSSGIVRRSKRTSSVITSEPDEIESISTLRSSPTAKRKRSLLPEENNHPPDVLRDSPRKKRKLIIEIQSRGSSQKNAKSKSPKSLREEGNEREEENEQEEEEEHEYVKRTTTKAREQKEDPENGRLVLTRRSASDQAGTNAPSNTSPKPSIVREEGADGRADRPKQSLNRKNTSETLKSTPVTDVKMRAKSKPINGPGSGSSTSKRLFDKRPTPPRRTLVKSDHVDRKRNNSTPTMSREPVGEKNVRGERPSSPAIIEDEISCDGNREGANSTKAGDIHSDATSDASGKGDKRQRMRSHSGTPTSIQMITPSPSKPRRGITARMKGKGDKGATSEVSAPRSTERVANGPTDDNANQDQAVAERRHGDFGQSLAASTSPPLFIPDGVDSGSLADAAGQQFHLDVYDDAIPLDQDDGQILPEAKDSAPIGVAGPNASTFVTEGKKQARGKITSFPSEQDVDDSEVSKGTVIPPTQSSQTQKESQASAQDDVLLSSMQADYGSSVVQNGHNAGEDVSITPAVLESSVEDITPPGTNGSVLDANRTTDNVATHKKIPIITPSKFKPYLPAARKPLCTLPPPLVQIHDLPDSLESPVKDFDTEIRPSAEEDGRNSDQNPQTGTGDLNSDDGIEDEMPRSLELQRRGLALAEMQRRKTREELQENVARIPLDVLLRQSSRASSSLSETHESEGGDPPQPDVEATGALTGLPQEGSSYVEDIDIVQLREFEQTYLDFDGNAGTTSPVVHDSGSTFENALGSNSEAGIATHLFAPEPQSRKDGLDDSLVQHPVYDEDPFVSRDVAEGRAQTPTTPSSHQDELDLPYSPARTRFKILGSPKKFDEAVAETPSRQLNEAMGLLHAKSEEIEFLKHQLAESEAKRLNQDNALAELQAENSVLKRTQGAEPTPGAEMEKKELEQCKKKCESLSKDRDALDAEIKLLQISRDDLTKEAELFRTLYSKASSFTDELRQENADLKARAELAEGQVNIGLELIRRQNAAQEQKWQAELEEQRILVHLLATKNSRTDDEVRRRAALEPELRNEIEQLQKQMNDLEDSQSIVIRQRNELLVEKHELNDKLEEVQGKYSSMVDDMCWLQVRVARLTAREKAFKKVFLTTAESDNEFDRVEERVYICKWMMNHDSKSRCNLLFNNVQDLKDHLFVDHQL